MDWIQEYHSPLGVYTMAARDGALTGLWLAGQKYFAPPDGAETADLPVFRETARWLDLYFSGQAPDFLPSLAPEGSPFRRAVWQALLEIPYGTVTTYGALAAALSAGGSRVSAQAVGGAVGHNPISLLIPCHRVVGADGSLTGYAGGVQNKAALLRLEGVDMTGLYVPARGTAL